MNVRFYIFIPLFIINACATDMNFSPEKSLTIEYMQTADASSDAQVAISNQTFAFIGFDRRGIVIPGVPANLVSEISKKCTIIHIQGMGDVIRSEHQKKQMYQAHLYSTDYNLEIFKVAPCAQNNKK